MIIDKEFTWLITGCAGFIGSNILEFLLKNNQSVIGVDNFSTGYKDNLNDVRKCVGDECWKRFEFLECDIRNYEQIELTINKFLKKGRRIDFLLHQAAIGSVPRSIEDPVFTHTNNVDGFINILEVAKALNIAKVVYASSSSVYGDEKTLPKVESKVGKLLSPYAASKFINEIYAEIYAYTYGLDITGLRYFNVFGPRQDPNGPYAAVIPKWIDSFISNKGIFINGDGLTSRDFCYVENVVQANILSALNYSKNAKSQVLNIAFGHQTTLNELSEMIIENLKHLNIKSNFEVNYRDFREGDIRHSLADISNAKKIIKYSPTVDPFTGLKLSMDWYVNKRGI